MAYNNSFNRLGNSRLTGFGIGPYDYFTNTYDSQDQLTDTHYYQGGLQDGGDLVAHITFTYDVSGNLLTAERVS